MDKILYVIDSLQTGGAERSTLEIASRLQHYKAVVCQLYQKDELSVFYKHSSIEFENLRLAGKYEFVKAISLLRAIIRKHQPLLVIGTLMRAELIARVACKLEDTVILGTFVNDTYSPEALDTVGKSLRLKIRFFQLWNALTAKFCAAFIANSEAIKTSNAAALQIPPKKIIVIHRGREIDKFQHGNRQITNSSFHFVSVGRLLERKGQLELIEAFYLFSKQRPGSTLTIAGEGPFRSTLEAAIAQHGLTEKVSLPGTVRDIASFLQSVDCFIFPSHYEGFSGALVEAALTGIPIIASDISMNREVLPKDGGYFFRVKNAEDLSVKMTAFADNIPAALQQAKRSRDYAIANFGIDKIVAAHEAAYAMFIVNKNLQLV